MPPLQDSSKYFIAVLNSCVSDISAAYFSMACINSSNRLVLFLVNLVISLSAKSLVSSKNLESKILFEKASFSLAGGKPQTSPVHSLAMLNWSSIFCSNLSKTSSTLSFTLSIPSLSTSCNCSTFPSKKDRPSKDKYFIASLVLKISSQLKIKASHS